jgi:lysine 2,3-aminomutase
MASIVSQDRHRAFDEGEFWRGVPGYERMDAAAFLDPAWQARASIRSVEQLADVLALRPDSDFLEDLRRGVASSVMTMRVSPYIVSRTDWTTPRTDPLRRQFLPLFSERMPDHPKARLDALDEQASSPVPGLTHRYPDKALLLALNTCPVYCAFCTRSYTVGLDTNAVAKAPLRVDRTRWRAAFDYLKSHPEVEDVVVSGGDIYNLSARAMNELAEGLLQIPSIRRIRIATKGLAVSPSRIGRDEAWTGALLDWTRRARDRMVSVALHTHFNHPNEITWVTRDAAALLFQAGVTIRNQSVLIRGVNDNAEAMGLLIRRLGHLHIQPYYVYVHDLVAGMETYRTSLQTAIELEKALRGSTAGFHMPTFVVDLPGGGGKRSVGSFETYDRKTGHAVFRSPVISDAEYHFYDPLAPATPEPRAISENGVMEACP